MCPVNTAVYNIESLTCEISLHFQAASHCRFCKRKLLPHPQVQTLQRHGTLWTYYFPTRQQVAISCPRTADHSPRAVSLDGIGLLTTHHRATYLQCPDTSRTTWNNTDGAQHTQTIHTRKGSHHCWPRRPTVGRYGADDGNSETGQYKFSHYNSSINLGPRHTFARTLGFTSATGPTALAHVCGYFCFYSRNLGGPSLFTPIPAQHTLLPSQDRRTISHCSTTRPRAATTARTIRRKFKAIHCLHVLSL